MASVIVPVIRPTTSVTAFLSSADCTELGDIMCLKVWLICLFRGLSIIQIQIILPQLFIIIKLELDLDYTRINCMIYPSLKSSYNPKCGINPL